MMWFGPWFSGLRVTFPGPNPSTWLLREQISENDKVETQSFCGEMDIISEARAVFICSKIEGDGPEEAMIKVFMQVPCMGTEKLSADRRSQQRGSSESADFEAGGLRMVTRAKCSSTPKLLAVKKTTQPKAWWIPGGYLAFVAMTKVPGIKIERIEDLCSQEQEEMKQSFKKAWIESYEAGVSHQDAGLRNLLWDRRNKKCYIVDFGGWFPSELTGGWKDSYFSIWNLNVYRTRRRRGIMAK